jgi:hypothetical protein
MKVSISTMWARLPTGCGASPSSIPSSTRLLRAIEDRGQRNIHQAGARVAAARDDGGDQMEVVQDHKVMVVQSSVHE